MTRPSRLFLCTAAIFMKPATSFLCALHRCRLLPSTEKAFQPSSVHCRSLASQTPMESEPPLGTSHAPQSLPNIVRLKGPVASGFGRGSKKLGFPTANLPGSLFGDALAPLTPGVYVGYALVEPPPPPLAGKIDDNDESSRAAPGPAFGKCHPAVVNVGFSPTFDEQNPEKIAEAYLIVDDSAGSFERDFYGCTMRLVLGGFLRPEQKFDSFPMLVAQITQDVKDAKVALTPSDSFNSGDHSELLSLPSQEPWLQPLSKQSDTSAAGTTENESGSGVEWSVGPAVKSQWTPPNRKWPEWQGSDVVTGGF